MMRPSLLANPATWYLVLGLGVLSGTVWVPALSAQRTARIEHRAEEIVGHLLEATRQFPGGIQDEDAPVLLARFRALAARDQAFVADLEVVEPPLPQTLLTLRNRHYVFHVAESGADARAVVSPGSRAALEVMAWPLDVGGAAHTVFFAPEDAPRAYTRNLNAGYAGLGSHRPIPARSHRRLGATVDLPHAYRDLRDERWIVY